MRSKFLMAVTGAATLAAGGALLPGAGAVADAGGPDGPGGVTPCGRHATVITHRDIDGDGRRDVVKIGGADDKHVIVTINGGETIRRKVAGSFVQVLGATRIDGRRGAEVVVADSVAGGTKGSRVDARVLTYRKHHLYLLASPTGGMQWRSHARPRIESGWTRHRAPGHRYLTHRVVRRVGDTKRFAGHAVDFRWSHGSWKRASSRNLDFGTRKAAERTVTGWKMRGVESWIGC